MTIALDHALDFVLPPELEAHEPPEVRGAGRDGVRLLVSWRSTGRLAHLRFPELPTVLAPGDLVVVNTSATLPAAVAVPGGREVRFSTRLPGGLHVVEIRGPGPGGTLPSFDEQPGTVFQLDDGGQVRLLASYAGSARLWVAEVTLPARLNDWLAVHGKPIHYGPGPEWPLAAYQTVYARQPGSAEMPSAGRPLTVALLDDLRRHGVGVAPLLLHTGVSSPEAHEPPYAEWYQVPLSTADAVNAARAAGGRVVAIGTTVVRALESASDELGHTHPAEGWTELVITPERGVRVVDALLTGWHEPRASHLVMLEAIAGRPLLERSYRAALSARYLWHHFGDSHLILP